MFICINLFGSFFYVFIFNATTNTRMNKIKSDSSG